MRTLTITIQVPIITLIMTDLMEALTTGRTIIGMLGIRSITVPYCNSLHKNLMVTTLMQTLLGMLIIIIYIFMGIPLEAIVGHTDMLYTLILDILILTFHRIHQAMLDIITTPTPLLTPTLTHHYTT
jgi:hypothetical protein